MNKKLPKLNSDAQVEKLLSKDLSAYLAAANLVPVTFEFAPKSRVVNLRMSSELLDAVKAAAKRHGVPYQKYIRRVLEASFGRKQ